MKTFRVIQRSILKIFEIFKLQIKCLVFTPFPVSSSCRSRGSTSMPDRYPGWDMAAVADIARSQYGGLRPMFEALGWPWTGSQWLTTANAKIVEEYGGYEQFVEVHQKRDQNG